MPPAVAHGDITLLLREVADALRDIFASNLVGVYLGGSLSYGDFEPGRSDIDVTVILEKAASTRDCEAIGRLHWHVERTYPRWAKRIECSYIPLDMLQSVLPPRMPRPYFGNGVLYDRARCGNEWLITKHLLRTSGIPLLGPAFSTLTAPVNIADVQRACIRDLHDEWKPKATDTDYLRDSHQQSYVVLNLCRILYTALCAATSSKRVAATWVMEQFSRLAGSHRDSRPMALRPSHGGT